MHDRAGCGGEVDDDDDNDGVCDDDPSISPNWCANDVDGCGDRDVVGGLEYCLDGSDVEWCTCDGLFSSEDSELDWLSVI